MTYRTIRCGADKRTEMVSRAVNVINAHRQNLSMTIAAYFHSPVSSDRCSSSRILPVIALSSPRIAARVACAWQVPDGGGGGA